MPRRTKSPPIPKDRRLFSSDTVRSEDSAPAPSDARPGVPVAPGPVGRSLIRRSPHDSTPVLSGGKGQIGVAERRSVVGFGMADVHITLTTKRLAELGLGLGLGDIREVMIDRGSGPRLHHLLSMTSNPQVPGYVDVGLYQVPDHKFEWVNGDQEPVITPA